MEDNIIEQIGSKIKAIREDNGYSIRACADLAGLSKSTIQNIEKGSFEPRISILEKEVV